MAKRFLSPPASSRAGSRLRPGAGMALASALVLVLASMTAAAPEAAADTVTTAPATGSDTVPATPDSTVATVPEDPMSNEAPGEEAPASDITVPPKTTYGGQEPFEPAAILWSSVAAAKRKLDQAQAAKNEAIAGARLLRKRRKQLGTEKQELEGEATAAIEELDRTAERLENRAVIGFQRFGSGSESAAESEISDYQQVVGTQRRAKMVASALEVDEADLARLDELRRTLDGDALALLDRIRIVGEHLTEAETGAAELDDVIDQAAIEYEAFKAGSEIFIHGLVFPIAGSYPTPLIDSFGFARMPGTPDEHWHEGIDLFAPRGTPLVATERGVVTRVGVGRLGGLKLWLKGESGSEWYYAHLDSFAPGLADGLVVEAGQLLGYVGNTGNAVGTPPHLHMQLHPDGDRPVNPYPLLKVVSDLDRAAMDAGTHPGHAYQPHTVPRPPVGAQTDATDAALDGESGAEVQPAGR